MAEGAVLTAPRIVMPPVPTPQPAVAGQDVEYPANITVDTDIDPVTGISRKKLAALDERLRNRERKTLVPAPLPPMTRLEEKIGFRLPKGCVSLWGRKNLPVWNFLIEVEEGIKSVLYHRQKGAQDIRRYNVYWPRTLWMVTVWKTRYLGMSGHAIKQPYAEQGRKTMLYIMPTSNNRGGAYGVCIGNDMPQSHIDWKTPADTANAIMTHLLYGTAWNEDMAGNYQLSELLDMVDWQAKSKDPEFPKKMKLTPWLDHYSIPNINGHRQEGPVNICTVDQLFKLTKDRLIGDGILPREGALRW
jgi:hypothetical protein